MTHIPPRQQKVEDKDRRFYVVAPDSCYLKLQQEAIQRGTDLWTLSGAVLRAWLDARPLIPSHEHKRQAERGRRQGALPVRVATLEARSNASRARPVRGRTHRTQPAA